MLLGDTLGARLAKAGGDDDCALDAFLASLLHHACDKTRGDEHDDQLDVTGDVEDRRIGFFAENLVGFGVDGVDATLEPALDDVFQYRVAKFGRVGRSTNHGHRFGVKELFKHG